jgi:hypothetical protein
MRTSASSKYFFGYLFVRIAKTIAVVSFLTGIAFGVLRYAQADSAAGSLRYRGNVGLTQQLDRLRDVFARTFRQVSASNPVPQSARISPPEFPRSIDNVDDFHQLLGQLQRVDANRNEMKEIIVGRFESLVLQIQQKLRAYAASLRPVARPSPSPFASSAAQATSTPAIMRREEPEDLFSKRVDRSEVESRSSRLETIRTFLQEQQSQAQTSEGKKLFSDSITEIEALRKLLPIRTEAPLEAEPTPPVRPPSVVSSEPEIPKPMHAEDVANQLEQYRTDVRESLLSLWALDEALDEATALASDEANKCQAATLAVRGIWLAAWGQIAMVFATAAFLAFLILVLADFTQALLDTATNTGITASRSQ